MQAVRRCLDPGEASGTNAFETHFTPKLEPPTPNTLNTQTPKQRSLNPKSLNTPKPKTHLKIPFSENSRALNLRKMDRLWQKSTQNH